MLTQTRLGGSLSCPARTESVGVHPGKQATGDMAGKRVHRGIDFTGDGRLKAKKEHAADQRSTQGAAATHGEGRHED